MGLGYSRHVNLLNDSNHEHEQYCNALLFVDESTLCTYRLYSNKALQGKGAWMKFWTLKRDAKGRIVGSVQDKIVLHISDVTGVKDVKRTTNNNIFCLVELWTSDRSLPLGIVEFDRNGKKISESKIRAQTLSNSWPAKSEPMLYDPSLGMVLTCKVFGENFNEHFQISFFECPARKLYDLYPKRTASREHTREYRLVKFIDASIEMSPCKQVAAVVTLHRTGYYVIRRSEIASRVRVHLISTQKPYDHLKIISVHGYNYETTCLTSTAKIFSKFANDGRTLVISVHEGYEVIA